VRVSRNVMALMIVIRSVFMKGTPQRGINSKIITAKQDLKMNA